MATPTSRSKTPTARLGTRLRGKLAEAFGTRGHRNSSLWCVYSPKIGRDVVLGSDLEFGHFLLVESDTHIKYVDYSASQRVASVIGASFAPVVDVEIETDAGERVWREVKSSGAVNDDANTRCNLRLVIELRADHDLAVRHELITEKEIYANPQRIHNWLRIVPWLAQARECSLIDYQNELAALLNARREVTLAEVQCLGSEEHAGLYVAALFKSVQQGRLGSDLDQLPLSPESKFFRLREAS